MTSSGAIIRERVIDRLMLKLQLFFVLMIHLCVSAHAETLAKIAETFALPLYQSTEVPDHQFIDDGSYFDFYRLTRKKGLLLAKLSNGPANAIVKNRLEALKNLRNFGGPKVYALSAVTEKSKRRPGIIVEFIKQGADLEDTKVEQRSVLDLVESMLEQGWVPLDVKNSNLIFEKAQRPRPIDVLLLKPREIQNIFEMSEGNQITRTSEATAINIRHQVTITADYLSEISKDGEKRRCRRMLRHLADKLPTDWRTLALPNFK